MCSVRQCTWSLMSQPSPTPLENLQHVHKTIIVWRPSAHYIYLYLNPQLHRYQYLYLYPHPYHIIVHIHIHIRIYPSIYLYQSIWNIAYVCKCMISSCHQPFFVVPQKTGPHQRHLRALRGRCWLRPCGLCGLVFSAMEGGDGDGGRPWQHGGFNQQLSTVGYLMGICIIISNSHITNNRDLMERSKIGI